MDNNQKNSKPKQTEVKNDDPEPEENEISSEITSGTEPIPSTSTNQNTPNVTFSRIEMETYLHAATAPFDKTLQNQNTMEESPKPDTNNKYKICTVKDMLAEILDCTVVRKPPTLIHQGSEAGLPLNQPSKYMLDAEISEIHKQISDPKSSDDENTCSQYTVKEVLNEILESSGLKKIVSCRAPNISEPNRPETSRPRSEYVSEGEIGSNQREYQVYRALGAGIIRSTSALQSPSMKSMTKVLPSYSTVLRMGPPPPKLRCFHSSGSFIPRIPPPSYAEVEGIWEDSPSLISSESVVFGPDPTYIVCPRCRSVVVTDTQMQRSKITHIVALVLCLCFCWPCCLLPYCLRSCNYTYHTCPNCRYYFGMYRPF